MAGLALLLAASAAARLAHGALETTPAVQRIARRPSHTPTPSPEIRVRPGRNSVRIELADCAPADAVLRIDGTTEPVGKRAVDVPPGLHRVEALQAGRVLASQDISFAGDQRLVLAVACTPPPTSTPTPTPTLSPSTKKIVRALNWIDRVVRPVLAVLAAIGVYVMRRKAGRKR
ncbi:MAG TPA: hypothetical protein ENK19_10255 [Acidobacteria bacterium]|nr:hypothetical protein [Acidobacteriota bacterium]